MTTIHRVAIESLYEGQTQVVNTFHLRVEEDNPFDSVSADELLDLLEDQLIPTYRILVRQSATVERIRVATEKDPTNPNDISVGGVREIQVTGGLGAGPQVAPHELCLVMSLRSSNLGRSFRGHMFLPPLSDADDCTGELIEANATYYGAALGLADVIRSMHGGGSFFNAFEVATALVVYSRTRRAAGHTPWFTDVTSVVVPRRLHWLRSRGS